MKTSPSPSACLRSKPRRSSGFTMVEIALSLAVVAFAMVAILGVLPTGMQVPRINREETIINQDGAYILEALRTGNDRLGVLSNSVYLITLNFHNGDREVIANENHTLDGQRIIGLLGTPKDNRRRGVSNVVAWIRALNTTAIDLDPEARDVAFRYQLVSEIQPVLGFPPGLTNSLSTNELARVWNLQGALHDVRLTFRWPLFRDDVRVPQNARVGDRRRVFRSVVSGSQFFYPTNVAGDERLVYYFQPSTY